MNALKLFALNFVLCLVVTVNWRAIASLRYEFAFVSDVTYFVIQYATVRRIVKSDHLADQAAYAVGGACGAVLGMWATRWF